MSNKPNKLKKALLIQSTPEAPQHTAQFSRVGFLILVAVSVISISLIILAIW
jgi:hypothetical protein